MLKLTAPDGHPVYVRATSVSLLQVPIPHAHAGGTRAIVTADGRAFAVTETPEQVVAKLA
jgi:hypothetical protein